MASFCVLLALLACAYLSFGQDPSCSTVKNAYRSKRLTEGEVPSTAVDGNNLRVCPKDNGKQCCSQQMEDRFTILSRGDFNKAVSSKVVKLRAVLNEQAKTFDDYFRGLIKKSQQDLDTMFQKIYQSYYQQNSKIFMDLFVDLIEYYDGQSDSDVNGIMDKFFSNLMSRMFQIMNARHQFSDSYLDCVSQHMKELKPFGDVPEKLKPQVRKVLIHARSFSQALFAGRDVVHMLESAVLPSTDCEKNLVKLKYCSWCKAMTAIKPCFEFCSDVYKGCVADLAKVNTQWENYIQALTELLERQIGPNDIHDVVTRLNVKISFAIMNFQQEEKMKAVKEKVFDPNECGNPGLTKRSTEDFFLEESNRQRSESDALPRTASSSVNLERLSMDFKQKMKLAENFWSALPGDICGDVDMSVKDKDSNCWNGVGQGNYTSPDSEGNDIEDVSKPTIQQAIERLKEIVYQLNAAIDGDELIPSGDSGDGSGSASGSASGDSGSGSNEIADVTRISPTESKSGIILDNSSDEGIVMAGGTGNKNPRSKGNLASQHHFGLWLLSLTLWVLVVSQVA